MLAVVVEVSVPRQHVHRPASQTRIQFIDTGRHLHSTALESGAELVIEFNNLAAFFDHTRLIR
jgi:hypothetical protein